MLIMNPIQMNDWKIKNFLITILAIQFAMWGAIGLDLIGFSIPLLREFIGFIYLFFVPGIIVLRILKFHKIGNIETLLLAVSISISILMFTGFLMNKIYPMFEISKPISIIPIIITLNTVVFLLCVLCYLLDKDFFDPNYINLADLFSLPVLSLSIVPFLTIFGTYIKNGYQSSVILMFSIVIIALIVILIGFDKFIPPNLYPLAILVISLSLLFHTGLISDYIWGWDIQVEYYITNLVIDTSLWNPAYSSNLNAMLSLVMLGPIFSVITNASLIWIFKITYPLLYSLVPLGLYKIYQKQTDDKIAFFSAFFFMSFFTFFTEMLFLTRQQIAELMLIAIILLSIDRNVQIAKRSILLILFTFSLVVSHYGLSYIFLASVIMVWIQQRFSPHCNNTKVRPSISTSFVAIFVVFLLLWYINVSSSSAFITIIRIGDQISSSITTDFLNPESAQGLAFMIKNESSLLHTIYKSLHLIGNFFITFGLYKVLSNRNEFRFENEYIKYSLSFFIMLLASIVLPLFARQFATSRIYHISLIFLAPFLIIGVFEIFKILNVKLFQKMWTGRHTTKSHRIISIFLILLLMFDSGWLFELTNDNVTSISLSNMDYPLFNEQEVIGKEWLDHFATIKNIPCFYADGYRKLLFLTSFEPSYVSQFPKDYNTIPQKSYSYFSTYNIINNEVHLIWKTKTFNDNEYTSSNPYTLTKNQIYTNGGCNVYYE